MTSDRELLEKAAKAAGYEHRTDPYHPGRVFIRHAGHEWQYFDPLNDDGDALRLAVKLRITLTMFKTFVRAEVDEMPDVMEDDQPGPYAATRRAIVRAAAAIGEPK